MVRVGLMLFSVNTLKGEYIMQQLVMVRFSEQGRLFTFRANDDVEVGDMVRVSTWVNPQGVTLEVEDTAPMVTILGYSVAVKVSK